MFPPAFPPTPSGLDSPAFPGTGTGLRPPTVPSNGSLSLTRVIRLLALKDYRAGSQKRSCSASSQLSSAGPPDLRSGPAGPDLAAPASAGALAGVVPRASPSSPGVPSCLRVFVPSSHRVFVSSCLRPIVSSCLRAFVPSCLRVFVSSSLRPCQGDGGGAAAGAAGVARSRTRRRRGGPPASAAAAARGNSEQEGGSGRSRREEAEGGQGRRGGGVSCTCPSVSCSRSTGRPRRGWRCTRR